MSIVYTVVPKSNPSLKAAQYNGTLASLPPVELCGYDGEKSIGKLFSVDLTPDHVVLNRNGMSAVTIYRGDFIIYNEGTGVILAAGSKESLQMKFTFLV